MQFLVNHDVISTSNIQCTSKEAWGHTPRTYPAPRTTKGYFLGVNHYL